MFKKLLSHSFLYSVAPQLPRLLSLLLLPIFTKYLTEEDYGIYGVITAYLFFISVLKDLGFSVVFVNTFYQHPKRWPFLWRLLHGHLIIWSFIYAAIYLLVLYMVVPKEDGDNFFCLALIGLLQIFILDNSNTIGNYYFRFKEKPLFIAIVSIVSGVVSVLATYLCIVVFQLGYLSWFIAIFAAALVSFVLYLKPIYLKQKLWPIITWRKNFINPYLRVSLPMIPHNYSSFLLNSSDRMMLDWYKVDHKTIGYYNFAYQFGSLMEVIGGAIGMAVGPFYTKMYIANTAKSLQDERNFTLFMMGTFMIVTFLASLWLKEVFAIMVNNDKLKASYDIGILILMGYSYRPMYWSAGIKLTTHGNTNILWRISAVGGVINVLLNLIFIPKYGIYAAAISTLIGLLYTGFAGFYFKTYQRLNLKGYNHFPTLCMILVVVFTTIVYFLRDISIVYKIVITIVLLSAYTKMLLRNFKMLNNIHF
ncbi:O-antigen/teichoic acid export membrane protein [Pedobacter sp. UYP24]